jgi:hypothetical protein
MWTADAYIVEMPGSGSISPIERIFETVWRCDFSAPGFCVVDLGAGVDSHDLRSAMVRLKAELSEIHLRATGVPFVYRSIGRFDQQETTKFHLDGAPNPSLLMLGYEPSRVRSRVSLADYSRAAFDLGITPQQFLREFNPMYRQGEEMLSRYVTELPEAHPGHSRILLINNSSLPFVDSRTHPLGVLHKAEMVTPDDAERRVVNSTMLAAGGPEEVDQMQQEAFVTTDDISKKFYG